MRCDQSSQFKLLYKFANQRPALKTLLDNIDNLSMQEITELKGIPSWVVKAMTQMKVIGIENTKNTYSMEQGFANIFSNVNNSNSNSAIMYGEIREWTQETKFVKVERGGDVEVKEGTLIWFPEDGGCWIDNLFCSVTSHILPFTSKVSYGNHKDYKQTVKDRLLKKHEHDNIQIITLSEPEIDKNSPTTILSGLGVRFY